MISEEDNKILTRVGRHTPMGELLRRYWHPIAATAELEEHPTKAVRLMGEDLVLFKDKSGNYGLIDRHCPHRRADLSYGMPEACGLRCMYHGWLFDHAGKCLEQPFEQVARPNSTFKQRVTATAYKVSAHAGLLWAYLGPEPAPLVPNWEPFTWKNGYAQVVFAELPCNWFQCYENSIDPVHFEWLHANWSASMAGDSAKSLANRVLSRLTSGRAYGERAPTHLKLGFDEFEYGFIYRRVVEGQPEDAPHWTVGRVALWPNGFVTTRIEWFVPVDDTNTLIVTRTFDRVPKEREPFEQQRVPYWRPALKDPTTQRWLTTHPMNQDFAVIVGQGAITDRTLEHLGESDRGIIMLRRRMLEQVKVVNEGKEPKGVVRDPEKNQCIALPLIERAQFVGLEALPAEFSSTPSGEAPDFYHIAGQPPEVRQEYLQALGLLPPAGGPSKRE
jgi:5,5'-dehydrodivanillate O-demethylase oxygenase subunit